MKLSVWKDIVTELRELIEEAIQYKESEKELYATLFEDVWIESDEEWREYYHDEIPYALKEIFKELGLSCRLYHKKDDVPGPEYVANCVNRAGRKIALGLDIDYDYDAAEVVLMFASAYRDAEWTPNQLVYYHET